MNFFEKVKNSILDYHFRKELSKLTRNRKACNLDNAKTVGLLYSVKDEITYNKITKLVKSFQDRNKIVKSLGFINEKSIPHYCHPKLSYDYFTLKELNWFNKPNNSFIRDFVNIDFDLLIDLSIKDNIYLQYISGISKAKFKVGKFGDKNSNYYDLMINITENTSLDKFIEQLQHYISIINK